MVFKLALIHGHHLVRLMGGRALSRPAFSLRNRSLNARSLLAQYQLRLLSGQETDKTTEDFPRHH